MVILVLMAAIEINLEKNKIIFHEWGAQFVIFLDQNRSQIMLFYNSQRQTLKIHGIWPNDGTLCTTKILFYTNFFDFN